jgi:hypothetical protein
MIMNRKKENISESSATNSSPKLTWKQVIALFLAMLQVLALPLIGFFIVIVLVFFVLSKLW